MLIVIHSPDQHAKQAVYFGCCLCDWEAAMREHMGGGLPVIGFYERKQDLYDTARRLRGKID